MPRPDRVRDGVLAALVGLTVAAAVGLGGLFLLHKASEQSLPALTEANRAAADTVGRAVADQIARAIGYGIPADGLYGVERYFDTIVAGSPSVQALALRDAGGDVLFETDPGVSGLSYPVTLEGRPVATVVLATAPALFGPAIDRLHVAIAATAGLFGLLGFVVAYLYLTLHLSAGRRRLAALMRAGLADQFPRAPATVGRGVVARANQAFERCIEGLRQSTHVLNDAVATVRAIDFDGSLSRRLEPIVAPVAGLLAAAAPVDAVAAERRGTAASWVAVMVAGVYAMALPFVANFAIDRDWTHLGDAWPPVMPPVLEAVAVLLGIAIGARLAGPVRPLAAAAGILAAGVGIAATAWTRDFTTFLALRVLCGLGLGIAVAALGAGRKMHRRIPVAAILFATLLAGPLLGGLIGEAVGRRATFVATGVLMLALIPVVLALREGRLAVRGREPHVRSDVLRAAAAGAAVGAALLVWLPAGPGYDDYLSGGLLFAAAGIAAAAVPLRSALAGAALAAAGLFAAGLVDVGPVMAGWPGGGPFATGAGIAVLGAGLRGLLPEHPARTEDALAGAAGGVALGAASVGMAWDAGWPALVPAAILVIALTGIAVVASRRPAAAAAAL